MRTVRSSSLFVLSTLAVLSTTSTSSLAFKLGKPSSVLQKSSKKDSSKTKLPLSNVFGGTKNSKMKKNLPTVNNKNGKKSGSSSAVVDYGAIGNYIFALGVQVTLSFFLWTGIDKLLIPFITNNQKGLTSLPIWISTLLVYMLNIQTSKFNPLPNAPEGSTYTPSERKRPSWTPPGWVFAVMWPLFVFGTRATTMAIVAKEVGYYANKVTMAMMVHFGFASLWNSINRVEQRLGVSMLMLYGMVITKAYTAYLAYQVVPSAGIALATTLSWICAAAALGTSTWKLNPDRKTGKLQSLYPTK